MTTQQDPSISRLDNALSLSLLKGTRTVEAVDMAIQQRVVQTIQETYAQFGFPAIETPLLCSLAQLGWKYEDDAPILDEIYQLSDRARRSLGLRYDLTVPFCRWASEQLRNGAQLPLKRSEIGRVFRDGPTKEGRLREFVQCDADIAGAISLSYDVECLLMADLALGRLSIDAEIEINQNKLLRGLLAEAGIEPAQEATAMSILDKWKKAPLALLRREAMEKGIATDAWETLIEWLQSCKASPEPLAWFARMAEANESIGEGYRELCEVMDGYERAGGQTPLRFVPELARGLGIYTGAVYEIFCRDRELFGASLGSGGRYDDVIPSFLAASDPKGRATDCPGVGLSFGLEPLRIVLCKMQKTPSTEDEQRVWIVPQEEREAAVALAFALRREGAVVEVDLTGRRPKKSFKRANVAGAAWVVFFGAREWEQNAVCLKDMTTGVQRVVPIDEVPQQLLTS